MKLIKNFLKLFFCTSLLLLSPTSWSEHPESFSQAKKLLKKIHADQTKTFYCQCDYAGKDIDPATCGYQPRKQAKRGKKLEIEHVVSAWEIGHQRQCWQEGGRKNCRKTDELFIMMSSDLHNLQPAVGELNGDRANFKFQMIEGEPRVYGQCDFEVDFKARVAEPPRNREGDIARTYFYMRDRYNLRISRSQTQLFNVWARRDPVDDWERERNYRITKVQGNSNCYISEDCEITAVRSNEISQIKSQARNAKKTKIFKECSSQIKYCSQMRSCDEAKHYLNHCQRYNLDRDGDGTPCESLCR